MSSAQARSAALTAPKTYARDDGTVMVEITKGSFVAIGTARERGLISAAEYNAALRAHEKRERRA